MKARDLLIGTIIILAANITWAGTPTPPAHPSTELYNSQSQVGITSSSAKQDQAQSMVGINSANAPTTVSPTLTANPSIVANPSQKVVITTEATKVPTNFFFTIASQQTTPDMQYDMSKMVKETATSLFDIQTWQYESIADWGVPVGAAVEEESLGKGQGYSEITIYEKRSDIKGKAKIITLAMGTIYAVEPNIFRAKLEKYILTQAKKLGANGIVKIACSAAIETKQKSWGIGAGASGTILERMGSAAFNIPVGLSYGVAAGNGIPRAYVAYQIVEVK